MENLPSLISVPNFFWFMAGCALIISAVGYFAGELSRFKSNEDEEDKDGKR